MALKWKIVIDSDNDLAQLLQYECVSVPAQKLNGQTASGKTLLAIYEQFRFANPSVISAHTGLFLFRHLDTVICAIVSHVFSSHLSGGYGLNLGDQSMLGNGGAAVKSQCWQRGDAIQWINYQLPMKLESDALSLKWNTIILLQWQQN